MPSLAVGSHKTGSGRRLGQIFWLFCLGLPGTTAAQADVEAGEAPATSLSVIARIEFTGNRVTKSQILLQEMVVKAGDRADPVLIERSRQAIMDLGLFISVHASVEPAEDGVVLRLIVKEKYYILPTPKLNRDDDNNYSLGAEISLDNLAGLNQKLKLRYENEEAQGASKGNISTSLMSYSYPRLLGSRWQLNTEVIQTYSPSDEVAPGSVRPLYWKGAWTASVQTSRWFNPLGQSRGWQLGSGLVWRHNAYDYATPLPATTLRDAQAVGVSLLGQHIDVHDFLFSRSGQEYGYIGEFGTRTLGSDTSYTRHEFFYR